MLQFITIRKYFTIPLVTLIIATICMGIQCNKVFVKYTYRFVEKVYLFPFQKTYKIGDTIWIEYSNISKKMLDENSAKSISVDSLFIPFDLAFNARFSKLINPSNGYCDFISSNGVNTDRILYFSSTNFLKGSGCDSSYNLNFKVGIIPKHIGIYSLDLSQTPRDVGGCPNRNTFFPNSTLEYRFDLLDCNKDVYLTIPPNSRGISDDPGSPEKLIDNKQIFVFVVE